ncbi:hypothetical protein BS47DRAFT_1329887 [Hydnum rufescens UP504]|uniref:Vacuolar calcium ion transporter n=1 Tax=Hydnum rufescens UP504 TaxID=1448309 RepID=A0A9P6AW18_9AGAM|nr:hypothetical protein BS47DRAFT_1329887 [Hydnum rufescens UP504]
MPRSESSPLLHGNVSETNSTTPMSPFIARLYGENEPSWIRSMKFFLGSWINILLLFIPLSGMAHYLVWDAGLRFLFSFIAIIPLARLLGEATEQLSLPLGQTIGGLLNASFGNAVEIIVGITALLHGEVRIVQTSMLGSILSNLLLVLGMSFFAGGLVTHENEFSTTAAQTSASLMTLSCITLIIPAAYHATMEAKADSTPPLSKLLVAPMVEIDNTAESGLLIISRGTSVLLLMVYVGYLVFQLKTHADLFRPPPSQAQEEEEQESMSMISAAISLLSVTVITSFCADWLVASIEETAEKYDIPKTFIGLILLPLVANAAEHVTSVWMAMKNKMELTIGISLGSSIQIAAFVVPLLVIVGWIIDRDLTLFFANFETTVLSVSVLLVNLLIQDGKSNYMEGLMLITLYIVIALAFWVS